MKRRAVRSCREGVISYGFHVIQSKFGFQNNIGHGGGIWYGFLMRFCKGLLAGEAAFSWRCHNKRVYGGRSSRANQEMVQFPVAVKEVCCFTDGSGNQQWCGGIGFNIQRNGEIKAHIRHFIHSARPILLQASTSIQTNYLLNPQNGFSFFF